MPSIKEYIISGALVLAGAVVCWYGFKIMHKYRLIQDIPRSKIRSIAMGLVEVHGNVLADKYIASPFSQTKCVYYQYKIEEYQRHTSVDSKGRTSTTYSWDIIDSGEKIIPFWAKDETGKVYVDPKGAEFNVSVKKVFLQRAGSFGAINAIISALKNFNNNKTKKLDINSLNLVPLAIKRTSFFSFGLGANHVGDRKYYEYYIEPEENLFVMGTADSNPKVQNRIFIKKGENEPVFIISNKSEKEVLRALMWQMIFCFVIGGIFLIIGIVWLFKISGLF